MTAGQVPIAATSSTVTSSKPMAGAGAGLTTGPTGSTTVGDVATFSTTTGQIQDPGFAPGAAIGNAILETTNWAMGSNLIYVFTGSSATNASLPGTIQNGFIASITNAGSATVTVTTGGPTLVCTAPGPSTSCAIAAGNAAFLFTDGTKWYATIN